MCSHASNLTNSITCTIEGWNFSLGSKCWQGIFIFYIKLSSRKQVDRVKQAAIKWLFLFWSKSTLSILFLLQQEYIILIATVMLSFSIRKGCVYEVLPVFIDPCVIFRVMNICIVCNWAKEAFLSWLHLSLKGMALAISMPIHFTIKGLYIKGNFMYF